MNTLVEPNLFSINITEVTHSDLSRIRDALEHYRRFGVLCNADNQPLCAACQLLYAIRDAQRIGVR